MHSRDRFNTHFGFRILRRLCLAIALLVLSATVPPSRTQAQDVEVKAELLGRRIAVGQSGTLVIHVKNGRAENAPREITAEGLNVVMQGDNGNLTNVNGVQQVEWFYYYNITGGGIGSYTIPAQTIQVRGTDYQTEPIDLVIYEPRQDDVSLNASQPHFAKLTLLETELYEFQIAPVELSVYVRGANSLDQISPPSVSDGDFIVKPFTRTNSAEIVDIDGWQYTRAKVQASAFPIRSGDRILGPVDLNVRIVESSQRSNSIFRTVFTQKSTVEMTSNAINLKVKPLPAEGRPAGFADTVGRFEITATAKPTDLKVGDPVSVDLTISGVGNFDNVPAPNFEGDSQMWRTYEPRRTQDPTQTSDGIQPGRVLFNQIVIPQVGATELPAFTMSYFDPQSGSYQTLRSAPIPLTIAADVPVAAAGSFAAATAGAGPLGGATPTPAATLTDILTIRGASSGWSASLADITGSWYFWLPQLLPAAVVLVLVGGVTAGAMRRRRTARVDPGAAESFAVLRRSLGSDPTVTASRRSFLHHVQRCLDAWRRERPDAESRLSPASAARLAEVESTLHDALYSGTSAAPDGPPAPTEVTRAKTLLSELAGTGKARSAR